MFSVMALDEWPWEGEMYFEFVIMNRSGTGNTLSVIVRGSGMGTFILSISWVILGTCNLL